MRTKVLIMSFLAFLGGCTQNQVTPWDSQVNCERIDGGTTEIREITTDDSGSLLLLTSSTLIDFGTNDNVVVDDYLAFVTDLYGLMFANEKGVDFTNEFDEHHVKLTVVIHFNNISEGALERLGLPLQSIHEVDAPLKLIDSYHSAGYACHSLKP